MSRVAGNKNPDPYNNLLTDLEQFFKEQHNNRTLAMVIFINAPHHSSDSISNLPS
jgi:hypothetical protein